VNDVGIYFSKDNVCLLYACVCETLIKIIIYYNLLLLIFSFTLFMRFWYSVTYIYNSTNPEHHLVTSIIYSISIILITNTYKNG
jgi:hypothetical protein